MHGLGLLHSLMREGCAEVHGSRLNALMAAVRGAMKRGRVTVTDIGRGVGGSATEKSNINRMSRLLGNARLYAERVALYRWIATQVMREGERALVVVDWTAGHEDRYLVLEAVVALEGRAVTVYSQSYPLSAYKNPKVQCEFVEQMAQVIPRGVRPLIMTDAGFQRSFFEAVEARGWEWVVRLSEPLKVRGEGEEEWRRISELKELAGVRPRELGSYWLRCRAPYAGRLCIVRPPKRFRRPRPNDREHGHGTMAKRYRRLYQGPWILATNLSREAFSAKRIVALYARRMQVEEGFRDLKSHRFGFAMDYSRSRGMRQLTLLRLVAALASLLLALVGLSARQAGWARYFQANTIRHRHTLSWFFLARRVLVSPRYKLTFAQLRKTLHELPMLANAGLFNA